MWKVLKTGTISKIKRQIRVLSEFIQRNPNYNNIKRNNLIIHNYIKKTHNIV